MRFMDIEKKSVRRVRRAHHGAYNAPCDNYRVERKLKLAAERKIHQRTSITLKTLSDAHREAVIDGLAKRFPY